MAPDLMRRHLFTGNFKSPTVPKMHSDNEVMTTMKKVRQSNIELLRIVAMLIIIGSHYIRYGVMVASTDAAREIWQQGSAVNKVLSCLFLPGGAVGVAIFFLISGYFSCEKEGYKPLHGIKKTVLECLFYGVILTILFLILFAVGYRPADVQGLTRICHMILASIFVPATSGLWWFITTWVFLMLLSPLLNKVAAWDKRSFTIFLVLYLFLCVTLDTALVAPYYNLERAVFFYLAGAYIKKYADLERVRRFRPLHGILFGICWVISAACQSPDFPYIDVSPLKKGLIDWGGGGARIFDSNADNGDFPLSVFSVT